MPLARLYVEGDLDAAIYNRIFDGVTVLQGSGKRTIKPQAERDRDPKHAGINAGYLRDRDFDFIPPESAEMPTIDAESKGTPYGWRLNRHELENYLIDPLVLNSALGIDRNYWEEQLVQAAIAIKNYQVARSTIGYVRSQLPPYYKLETTPKKVNELRLPDDLSEESCFQWCHESVGAFREKIEPVLMVSTIDSELAQRKQSYSDERLSHAPYALTWCSGKDLLAALDQSTMDSVKCSSAGELIKRLLEWVIKNPQTFLLHFPELQQIRTQLLA